MSRQSKYKYTDEQLTAAVKASLSMREAISKLGIVQAGGNYKTIKSKIKLLELDINHWTGRGHLKGKTHNWGTSQTFDDILVEDSTYTSTNRLKNRLIKAKLLERKCYECGITEWRGLPAPVELEHKNGVNNDHRLENLTLLCPNCHSQTATYRGKNKKRA